MDGENKLRVAVIGAGRLGAFHAQKLAARKDVELLAVVDPVAENRARTAAACNTVALPDFHSLLGRLEAAILATPATTHYALAAELLQCGVHLLVEKPLCTNRWDAAQLVALARRRGLVLQVGHVERFNPAFQAAAAEIPRPLLIEARRAGGFTFRAADVGVVLDLMIHDIDLVLSLFGSLPERIAATGLSLISQHEDVADVRLEFEDGAAAVLSAARVVSEPERRLRLWSAAGFAEVDLAARKTRFVHLSEPLWSRRLRLEDFAPEQPEAQRLALLAEHMPSKETEFAAVDALALEQDDFIAAVRTGKRPRVDGTDGERAVAVAEEILRCIHAERMQRKIIPLRPQEAAAVASSQMEIAG